MKRALTLAAFLAIAPLSLRADITMPVRDTFYDKLGRGMADIIVSPSEMLDSQYSMIDTEGPTKAFFKGFIVQGISRMAMDVGMGIFEVATAPFPTQNGGSYRSMKLPPYDSMVVNDYPPADLHYFY